MEAQGPASVVSVHNLSERRQRTSITDTLQVDFALTEAAYAIVKTFQKYPTISLPEGERVEPVGVEKQSMTMVIKVTDGCKVNLGAF
jgi:hypothetical protein